MNPKISIAMNMRKFLIIAFAGVTFPGLLACDDEININDVTVQGTVFRTPSNAGILVDITQLGSPMYRLAPEVNGVPAQNLNQSERYLVNTSVQPVNYDSLYILDVEIKDEIIADTVKMPGNFRILAERDTFLVAFNFIPTVTWTRADSVSSYFVELWYYDNFGNVNLIHQQQTGQDTTYTLPRLDAYGVFRVDVYAYLYGIYHPDRGHLTTYSKPVWWPVHGSWNAWVRRSVAYWVL